MRIVTFNLWGARAPLSRRLEVAAQALAALAPDAVLLQEVRCAPDLPNTAEQLAALLGGWRTAYACAIRGEAGLFGPGSGPGEEGVAVITPHEIAEMRSRALPETRADEARIILSVLVATPATRFWAHTTHLHWRLADGVARERQVAALDAEIRAIGDSAGDVHHVLGGDLNAAPDCDEIRFLRGRHTLEGRRTYWQDAFLVARPDEPGFTWAKRNPMTEHLAFLERDRRIDYLFVRQERRDGRGRVVDARVVLDAPAADGTWPSDHFGVLAEIDL